MITHALLQSLIGGPLLIERLPEASPFPHHQLALPAKVSPLNLRQKLGHLYEDALALLLDSSPRFDLLARNLQIRKDIHTTVGELDFLLRERSSGRIIHLELATKFYLAVTTDDGFTFPGPDARDNYFKKVDRLRNHQLQLPRLFKDHLPQEFRAEPIVTQHLVYGCLFDRIGAKNSANPEFLNPDCRRGKWLHAEDLVHHFPPDTTFQIIPKPLWPVPLELLDHVPLDPWNPILGIDRCLMVKVNDLPSPYFIAPTKYPHECFV